MTAQPSGLGVAPVIGPLLSSTGAVTGICTIQNTAINYGYPCWNLNGSVSSNKYGLNASYNTLPGSAGDVWVIGSRVYHNHGGLLYCYDYAELSSGNYPYSCSGFVPPINRSNYTIRAASDVAPNCLIATGDSGEITLFNAKTGRSCLSDTDWKSVRVGPSASSCGSGPAGFKGWGTLSLPGLVSGTYTNATVTLQDQNNSDITAGGVTYHDYPLAPGGTIDLSRIPTSVTSILAWVKVNGVNDPPSVESAQVAISWVGDPPEMCYQTTVPSYGCDVTSTTISNYANAVTSSSGGSDSSGGNSTGLASFTVQTNNPACTMTLTKTANTSQLSNPPKVGDRITYSYSATNTSNVTLTNVLLDDPLPLYGHVITWPGATGVLAPGQAVTVTAFHNLTQAEVDSGHVLNTVTARGQTPTGSTVTPPPAMTDTSLRADPQLTLAKTANTSQLSNPPRVGDRVTYTYTATNTGNVTLTGVQMYDQMSLYGNVVTWPGAAGVLAPGQTYTITAYHNLTQAEIDSGHVANTVTGEAKKPDGSSVPVWDKSTDTSLRWAESLALTKTASSSALSNPPKPGDRINYTFTITNTGNVTINNVVLTDPLPLSGYSYSWPGTAGTLAPGQVVTITAYHTVTQTEIDTGKVPNTATATAKKPNGDPVAPSSKSTETSLPWGESLALTKTASSSALSSPPKPGDRVNYTFTITNTGNVTINNVVLTDPLPLSGYSYSWPGTAGTLAPGQVVTITAYHVVTQAEINTGKIANTATATGKKPNGDAVAPPSKSTETSLSWDAQLTLAKTASATALSSPPKVGDKITYTYSATNTGNVTLTNVSLTDPLPLYGHVYSWPGTAGTLAPGQTYTVTAFHNLTQAEIDSGHVANTVSGAAKKPNGDPVPVWDKSTDTPLTRSGALTLRKTASTSALSNPPKPGDRVNYTFTITNSGNVTMTNVALNDPLSLAGHAYSWPGTAGTLAPGQVVTITAYHVVTQADIDTGHIANSATSNGKTPTGSTTTSPPSTTDSSLRWDAQLTLAKTASTSALSNPPKVGDKITYTYSGTNTGNVTLTNVSLTDPLPGLYGHVYSWPGAAGTLAPGQTYTITAFHNLTQAELDAGHVANTVSGAAKKPNGDPVPVWDKSTDTGLTQSPALTLTKTAGSSTLSDPPKVGDRVDYTFTITNTGNVTMTNVALNDAMPLSGHVYTWPGPAGTLTPGQVVTITAYHTVTQADLNTGHLANTATATGKTPSGSTTTSPPKSTTTPLRWDAQLTLAKTASTTALSSPPKVGDKITYTYSATNTGNVTVTNVALTDPLPLYGHVHSWPGTAGTLAPGQTYTVTAIHDLTQAEIDSGHVANTVSGAAKKPNGDPVPVWDKSTDTGLTRAPALTLTKTANSSLVSTPAKVGDKLTYTITVTNTGNVTVTSVRIVDPLPGLVQESVTWPGAAGTLLPGQVVTAVYSYRLTQADINAGHVANSATSTGSTPTGGTVDGPPKSTDTPIGQAPGLTLKKTANASHVSNPSQVGETITYTFTATNTGNITLTEVVIVDPLPGLSALTYTWPGTAGTLQPGQVVTATADYVLTQDDIDAAHVANSATASGKTPSGSATTTPPSTTDTPLSPLAAIDIEKRADLTALHTPAAPGDVVTYTFVAKNTGTSTLTDVTIEDPLPGLSALTITWPGAEGTLLPAEELTAIATYLLTQADIEAGHVSNTATATGTPPTGDPVADESTVDSPVETVARIALVKSADASQVQTPAKPGDVITFTLVGTNTGTTTLLQVTIADPLSGLSALAFTWPGPAGTLLPGQSVTATATYQVTKEDLELGRVSNAATITGTPPNGGSVTETSTVDVPVTPEEVIQLSEVVWRKVDATPAKNLLEGAEWTFTALDASGDAAGPQLVVDCSASLGTSCAGADVDPVGGLFHLTGVAPGTYHLVETRAPVGFILNSTPIVVTVGATTSTVTVPDVVNEQQPAPVIPFTGGLGTDTLTFTGLGLLVLVIVLAVWHTLRRRRRLA